MSREYLEKRLREIAAEQTSKRRAGVIDRSRRTAAAARGERAASATPVGEGPLRKAVSQIPEMRVSGRFVYEASSEIFGKPLRSDRPCGMLFDRLLGVVAARPPYLHTSDAARYAALIQRLQSFVGFSGPVADLPLERLHGALSAWVNDAIRRDESLLMPSYVLDAARFVEAHAYGRDFGLYGGDTWEIKPLVEGLEGSSSELNTDRRLKSEITTGLRGTLVRLELPQGARVVSGRTKELIVSAGPVFAQVERCHLSSGLGPDTVGLEIIEEVPMRHDVAEEFRIVGVFWPSAAVAELISEGGLKKTYRRQNLYVPGRFVNATLEPVDDGPPEPLHWVNAPSWSDFKTGSGP